MAGFAFCMIVMVLMMLVEFTYHIYILITIRRNFVNTIFYSAVFVAGAGTTAWLCSTLWSTARLVFV